MEMSLTLMPADGRVREAPGWDPPLRLILLGAGRILVDGLSKGDGIPGLKNSNGR